MPYHAPAPRLLAAIATSRPGSAGRFSHADTVKLWVAVKRRSAESATVTRSSTPSKLSAPPSCPPLFHVGPPASVPLRPAPEESPAVAAAVSSKRQWPRIGLPTCQVLADAGSDHSDSPAALNARTRYV